MNDLFGKTALSVSQITTLIKRTLEGSFYGLTIQGEISNFKSASSGHWYFQLNDENAAIQAVMFRQQAWRVTFVPKDGDVVIVTGDISVYEKRGSYQIICTSMIRFGAGDILAMLEQRKREFAEAGYFDPARKRPLPAYPRTVGVVTSPTGAAIQDILQVLGQRNSAVNVIVLPTAVQGEEAAATIASQIRAANRLHIADVLIVGRGGGSVEDLLPFSEKCVIEAIVASEIPIISAVGHEIDWALSDYAADVRAPTPSAAAQLVSPSKDEILSRVASLVDSIGRSVGQRIALARSQIALFTPNRMAEYFSRRLEHARLALDDLSEQIARSITDRLRNSRHALEMLQRELSSLSPLAVLQRGYAIVTHITKKQVITDAGKLVRGDTIDIRFAQGSATAAVETVQKEK